MAPMYNEEEVLSAFIKRIQTVMSQCTFTVECILIDDGSTDRTRMIISDLAKNDERFTALVLSKNHGHQLAITAGLHFAKSRYGVFIIDSDLQDPPELIIPWYQLLTQDKYDVIYGVRSIRNDEGGFKKKSSKFFYKFLNWMTSQPIPLDSGDFCMMSARVVRLINAMPERYRFVRGLRASVGFRQKAYPYEREKRVAGTTKYSFRKMFGLALDAIYGFSEVPYKFMMNAGILLIGISVVYLIFSMIKSLIYGTVVSGFIGLLTAIILIGGINLLGLGVLGGYIIRNFFELKARPLFIVDEIIENQESIKPDYAHLDS